MSEDYNQIGSSIQESDKGRSSLIKKDSSDTSKTGQGIELASAEGGAEIEAGPKFYTNQYFKHQTMHISSE